MMYRRREWGGAVARVQSRRHAVIPAWPWGGVRGEGRGETAHPPKESEERERERERERKRHDRERKI